MIENQFFVHFLEHVSLYVYHNSSLSKDMLKKFLNDFPEFSYNGPAFRFLGSDNESPHFSNQYSNMSWTRRTHFTVFDTTLDITHDYIDMYSGDVLGLCVESLARYIKKHKKQYLKKYKHLNKDNIDNFIFLGLKEKEILVIKYANPMLIKRQPRILQNNTSSNN